MKLMKKLNIKIQDDAEKIVSEENKNFENAGYESKCKLLINCFLILHTITNLADMNNFNGNDPLKNNAYTVIKSI